MSTKSQERPEAYCNYVSNMHFTFKRQQQARLRALHSIGSTEYTIAVYKP